MIYSLTEISSIVQGQLIQFGTAADLPIRHLAFDSRTILTGRETLFFALKSSRTDGHKYLTDAYDKEVPAFVVERLPERPEAYPPLFW
jgi:alanine racemase